MSFSFKEGWVWLPLRELGMFAHTPTRRAVWISAEGARAIERALAAPGATLDDSCRRVLAEAGILERERPS